MKKFAFYLTISSLLFFSCDTKNYSSKRSSGDDSLIESKFNVEHLSDKTSSTNSIFNTTNNIKIDSLDWSDSKHIKFNSNEELIYIDTQWKLISKENFMDSVLNYTYGSVRLISTVGKGAHKLKYIDNLDRPDSSLASPKQENFGNFSFGNSPNFIFEDLNGDPIDNNIFNNKVVVLNFWFIGCKGCMLEIPFLNNVVGKNKYNKEMLFIASSDDSRSKLEKFLMVNEFNYRVTTINNKDLKQVFDVTTFPTHMIIGKDGNIKYKSTGGSKIATMRLEQEIEKVLMSK